MTQQWDTVLYEKIDNVAKLTMNRPEVRNAQSWHLLVELDQAFKQAELDEDIRVIILAGAGPHFSSGHDLGSPQAREERAAEKPRPGIQNQFWREADIYNGYCFRWRDIPKATIAQVQGACIAAGMMVAAACDLIVASEDAIFSDPVLNRLSVGGVEYFHHPWDLGIRKAKEILFTAEPFSAQEAWRLGLVNRVVPRENLEEETMLLAKKIALMPAFALAMTKASVNETWDIMGFRDSVINHFKYHQLAHAHNALVSLQGGPSVGVGGQSVKDWAKQKDEKFDKLK